MVVCGGGSGDDAIMCSDEAFLLVLLFNKCIIILFTYMQIMFRGDFTYPGWNDPSKAGGFCGYHTLFRIYDVDAAKYVYLKVSIIGNPWTASPTFYPCMSQYSPNNLPGADSIVSVYAHELTEVCMYVVSVDVDGCSLHATYSTVCVSARP